MAHTPEQILAMAEDIIVNLIKTGLDNTLFAGDTTNELMGHFISLAIHMDALSYRDTSTAFVLTTVFKKAIEQIGDEELKNA
jgi:hypothetical protein